jgi:hypothetical protein
MTSSRVALVGIENQKDIYKNRSQKPTSARDLAPQSAMLLVAETLFVGFAILFFKAEVQRVHVRIRSPLTLEPSVVCNWQTNSHTKYHEIDQRLDVQACRKAPR